MRKVTQTVCGAFLRREKAQLNNTSTDGQALFLHGNRIAEWRGTELWITNAGWFSNVTRERLNGLGASVSQMHWNWYLNGKPWDGSWAKING